MIDEGLREIWLFPGLVQMAGIHDVDEARLLLDEGVHLLGFPLCLDYHDEDIPPEEVAHIVRALGLERRGVLITYLDRPGDIIGLVRRTGVGTVQLHGSVSPGSVGELRRRMPGLVIVKSLIVRESGLEILTDELRAFEDLVDAFITDTFDPVTGACGATGRTHDWRVSRRLREATLKPLILAGGLSPINVREAILAVRPFGVDAHTGIEGFDGRKDPSKVKSFMALAKRGFEQLHDHAGSVS